MQASSRSRNSGRRQGPSGQWRKHRPPALAKVETMQLLDLGQADGLRVQNHPASSPAHRAAPRSRRPPPGLARSATSESHADAKAAVTSASLNSGTRWLTRRRAASASSALSHPSQGRTAPAFEGGGNTPLADRQSQAPHSARAVPIARRTPHAFTRQGPTNLDLSVDDR